ncbi:TPA: ParB/RepB/Spo0J family partition protein, partial [Escherichia coli]|nr:ParB/RepB/Spo0J family partition protein [Escherichia coli]
MPVTKCEPETTRKASRKSVKTQETVLSALLAQTEEVSVPLDSLIKSPLNVRTVPYSAESVSELADSIKGVGLLQNLVVHALPGDRYGVAAGGRRLAALNMLAERDIIPADWPVRVKVIPQELATAASMTENGHRRDMHPAEQIAGFRAMAQEGKTPAQIGDLLGYSPRHVQRMLKLADLAPVILDALAEDRITTEHCQALALESAIGFHMRDWWQPTKANFFGHLKKPQIIAALNEAGLSGAARDAEKMKKGDAAEHAEFHMKDNCWVPGWMCAPRPQTD